MTAAAALTVVGFKFAPPPATATATTAMTMTMDGASLVSVTHADLERMVPRFRNRARLESSRFERQRFRLPVEPHYPLELPAPRATPPVRRIYRVQSR